MRQDELLEFEVLVSRYAPAAEIDKADPLRPMWQLDNRKVSVERVPGEKSEYHVRGWRGDKLVTDSRGLVTIAEAIKEIRVVLTS